MKASRPEVVVITGATAGIGRATVREFARHGASIALLAREPERLEATRAEVEQLGGKPAPAVGWGMGIERMLLLLEAVGAQAPERSPDIYAIVPGPQALSPSMATCEALRAEGLSVVMNAVGADGWNSMKSQFKKADASGARMALVFGDDELARGEVAIKSLRDASIAQRVVPLADVASWAADLRTP